MKIGDVFLDAMELMAVRSLQLCEVPLKKKYENLIL